MYAFVHPDHLRRQAGLDPDTAARAGRIIGVRDVASGAAIVLARSPDARRAALLARVGCDVADLAVFGALARSRAGRARAMVAAGCWAAVALLLANGFPRPHGEDRP